MISAKQNNEECIGVMQSNQLREAMTLVGDAIGVLHLVLRIVKIQNA